MDESLTSGPQPGNDGPDDEDDLEPVEDEFDPFADRQEDPPPEEGQEGDDRVHEGS